MEEQIIYSTVIFRNGGAAPNEKKEDPKNESEVKPKEAAAAVPKADDQAAEGSRFGVLVACFGILCVLLAASISVIIYFSFVMKDQSANLNNLTAENELLIVERRYLSRVTDNLNWTLEVILKFKSFPVNDFCPNKHCQPCRKHWILFQEKCYMFYNIFPWKTWQESRKFCQDSAADLVVVDNLHEQEFISNRTKYYFDKFHGYWLGLHETKDKYWVWIDGRNDTLGYWLMENLGTPGKCGLMIPGRNLTASWDPADCPMRNRFICASDVLTKV
ncbi:C-type lectin domain family 12 member B-like isoform X2 [Anoplopoma fimbria]|uniref:C-type lectin domain family 12 member B-like isoform X2 n=1 Tax=Anoplopoma fimbria TaxID=229290 RepID=UPI0023EAFBE3|nr:C-type lectin domain family 12 member B-like isoform X2 [Anoplopoma fimbria]